MDVDLVRLRYFATVADHLHFGRAAAALRIARPVLSRAITELEAELGVELFVRPAERTTLTEAGRALHERARALLAADDVAGLAEATAGEASPTFTVAIAAGVTISKWTRLWAERRADLPLRVLRTDAQTQLTVLREGAADVSFVRLPVERAGLSTIPLYSEASVVVVPKDHELTLLDSVSVVDLVEEHLLQDPDTVPQWRDAALARRTGGRRPLPELATMADAIALVAAGLGIVIVPQSVARLHHRKDVTYRPVVDVVACDVAVIWLAERTTPDIEEFIGIVRGRSARSSRSPSPAGADPPAPTARSGGRPLPPPGTATTRAASSARKRGTEPSKRTTAPSKTRRPRGSR